MKSDDIYLARMCDSVDKIRRTTQNVSTEEFAIDEQAVASVILWLTQIGELAKRVSPETKTTSECAVEADGWFSRYRGA